MVMNVTICGSLQRAKLDKLWVALLTWRTKINIQVTNASESSTVAIDDLDIRVGSRTCDANEPICVVYELTDSTLQTNSDPTGKNTDLDDGVTPARDNDTQRVTDDIISSDVGTFNFTTITTPTPVLQTSTKANPGCLNSRLGTSSCSFHKAQSCDGVDNGYDCEHLWIATKSQTGQIVGGSTHSEDKEDGYSFLKITDATGSPCKLDSMVFFLSVKAVCIEFHYATTGDYEHGINVGFENENGQTYLFSVPARNTAGNWYKVGASCCLQGSDYKRYLNIAVTNASASSTVAIDQLNIYVRPQRLVWPKNPFVLATDLTFRLCNTIKIQIQKTFVYRTTSKRFQDNHTKFPLQPQFNYRVDPT